MLLLLQVVLVLVVVVVVCSSSQIDMGGVVRVFYMWSFRQYKE